MDGRTAGAASRGWEKLAPDHLVRIALYGEGDTRRKALRELERRIELEQKSARR